MTRFLIAIVTLTSVVSAIAQPIDPWQRTSPAEAGGATITMQDLQTVLIEQADLIQSIAGLTGESANPGTTRGAPVGLARLVECNGLFGYNNIQSAIDESVDGDVIVVFPNTCNEDGRWFENLYLFQKKIRLQSTNPHDASIVELTVIDGTAPPEQINRSVITCYSVLGDTVFHGLTLTNGYGNNGNGVGNNSRGGGLYCYDSAPSIWDCRVVNNYAAKFGGGIYQTLHDSVAGSTGEIRNCLFAENVSGSQGGAIFLSTSYETIASTKISNCFFERNGANGGALIDCHAGGGGTMNIPLISSCTFLDNTPYEGIIGAFSYSGGSFARPKIRSCVVAGNVTRNFLFFAESVNAPAWATVEIENCTVVNNVVTFTNMIGARAIREGTFASVDIRNSIFWSNPIPSNRTEAHTFGYTSEVNIEHSNFEFEGVVPYQDEGVIWGEGNFSTLPGFVSPGGIDDGGTPADLTDDTYIPGDYHLLSTSLCIDSGDPDYEPFEGDLDIDSENRIMNCRIDVGADEFDPMENPTGDYDGNAIVDLDDLASFASALLDPQPCNLERGDTNNDGDLNGLDIPGFVTALLDND